MDINSLGTYALVFVVAVITIAIGSQILGQFQLQQTTNSLPYNISGQGLTSLNTFGTWLPLLALVVVAAIVIGVILNNFARSAGV